MRYLECRDPGHIPRAIEVCRECAPLYYAREEVALLALAWWRRRQEIRGGMEWDALEEALRQLDGLDGVTI